VVKTIYLLQQTKIHMKHFLNFLTLAFALSFSNNSIATILVANNSTTSPGQYSTLQAAINAASSGDTIHVQPSTNMYDDTGGYITLDKKLTLIGIGHKPVKDNPLVATLAPSLRISGEASSSGFTIIGLAMGTCLMACGQPVYDATFINCKVGFGTTYESNCFSTTGWYNLHVENCVVEAIGTNTNGDNILYTNCIITTPDAHFGTATTNVLVKNCLFIYHENWAGGWGVRCHGGTFENNIFYITGPALGNGPIMTNCTFNNNLTYQTINDILPFGTNTGQNNIINQDPQFVSYTNSIPVYQIGRNFRLQESSPGHNAGTDGTDIGPYGGGITFSETGEYPELPVVRVMNIDNATVPSEGTISIHVKVTKSKTDH
jgi:hypothetical protein